MAKNNNLYISLLLWYNSKIRKLQAIDAKSEKKIMNKIYKVATEVRHRKISYLTVLVFDILHAKLELVL
jgi:hypothetical protein